MLQKKSVLLLILFIVGLYLLQNKGVIPFVTKVAESDLFVEKSDEDEELGNIRNDRTDFAFTHCKNAFREEYNLSEKAELSNDQYEAWALGNKTYLVRSSVILPEEDKGTVQKSFACKVQFAGGDAADASNWSIAGIDFDD